MARFIFYDPRNKRVKKLSKIGVYFIQIVLTVTIFVYSSLNYHPSIQSQNYQIDKNILMQEVDDISTENKDTIGVEGIGPITDIIESESHKKVIRSDFNNEKKVILSFDDGPDPIFTRKILDILDAKDISGIFFLIGDHMFKHPGIAKEVFERGNEVGVHTYSHPDDTEVIYGDFERLERELDLTQKLLINEIGKKSTLFRVPRWGAEDEISLNTLMFISYAKVRGYHIISTSLDSHDWKNGNWQNIVNESVNTSGSQIVLLHDGGGDRTKTIEALPKIIEAYKDNGYEFIGLQDILKDGESAIYEKVGFDEIVYSRIVYVELWFNSNIYRILQIGYTTSLGVSIISTVLLIIFSTAQYVRSSGRKKVSKTPSVSVLLPAFNEEKTIKNTIESLLKSDYKNMDIIVIDNNSNDSTYKIASKYKKLKIFKILKEKVQGKYAALNRGLFSTNSDIVVVIDADTQVLVSTISEIVKPFEANKTGAVSGNIKVGNLVNTLTRMQALEYVTGLNLDRRAYDLFGANVVIPGALGAWKTSVLKRLRGFKGDTIAEDADMSVRVQRLGYHVAYASDAIAYTEAPETLKQFLKQRERWVFGIFQVLFKNKDIYFSTKKGFLGAILLPYLAFIQLPFLLLAPIIDISAIFLLIKAPMLVVYYFSIYLLIQMILAAITFFYGKDGRIWLILYIPLMRIYYQSFWYFNLYKCFIKAIRGDWVNWNKLEHKGTVELSNELGLDRDLATVQVKYLKKFRRYSTKTPKRNS